METAKNPYTIKRLGAQHLEEATTLAWDSFVEFVLPDCQPEGMETFKRFIDPGAMSQRLSGGEYHMWGGFICGRLVGVLLCGPECRVNMLFVAKSHHRRGLARNLIYEAAVYYRLNTGNSELRINASPYSLPACGKLGFRRTGAERTAEGLRFTPMKRPLI
jgi:GNAT superfamily N-acetyltransferase